MSELIFFCFFISVLIIVSMWHIFRKAGKPGWASIIPIYNTVVWLEIADKPVWWVILFFVPLVNIFIAISMYISIAKKFGKSGEFGALGLTFLPFIFFPILASPKAEYINGDQIKQVPSRINKLGVLITSLLIYCFMFFPFYFFSSLIIRLTRGPQDFRMESLQYISIPFLKDWALLLIYIIYLLLFISAIAIWKYKKWGIYSFVGLYILIFIINISNGFPVLSSITIFTIPVMLILFLIPYWSAFKEH